MSSTNRKEAPSNLESPRKHIETRERVRRQGVCPGVGKGGNVAGRQREENDLPLILEVCLPPLGCHLVDPPMTAPGQESPTSPSDHRGRGERRRVDPPQGTNPLAAGDSTRASFLPFCRLLVSLLPTSSAG